MTPKEKAIEIWYKFYDLDIDPTVAKMGALISVKDTIEALEHNTWQNKDYINYYNEVKQEIEKL